jgi:hypothetical protein
VQLAVSTALLRASTTWWLFAIWDYCQRTNSPCSNHSKPLSPTMVVHKLFLFYSYTTCLTRRQRERNGHTFTTRPPFVLLNHVHHHTTTTVFVKAPKPLVHVVLDRRATVRGSTIKDDLNNGIRLGTADCQEDHSYYRSRHTHSGGLLFLWIGYHGRQYCMNAVVSRKNIAVMMRNRQQDTRYWCIPGLFLPPTAEITMHEHWYLEYGMNIIVWSRRSI